MIDVFKCSSFCFADLAYLFLALVIEKNIFGAESHGVTTQGHPTTIFGEISVRKTI